MTRQLCTVRLEGFTDEAWAAAALIQSLSEQAKLCGFSDVERIDVSVNVVVVGATFETSITALRARLQALGVGAVADVEVRELPTY